MTLWGSSIHPLQIHRWKCLLLFRNVLHNLHEGLEAAEKCFSCRIPKQRSQPSKRLEEHHVGNVLEMIEVPLYGRKALFSNLPSASECFLKTALLRYNLHLTPLCHLQRTLWCAQYIYRVVYHPQPNFSTFSRRNPVPVAPCFTSTHTRTHSHTHTHTHTYSHTPLRLLPES